MKHHLSSSQKFFLLLLVGVLLVTGGTQLRFSQANILEHLDGLSASADDIFRDEPELAIGVSALSRYFRNAKDDAAIAERYQELIRLRGKVMEHEYLAELLTYVHVFEAHDRAVQERHLPMYPDDNIMTYELAAALHFQNNIFFDYAKQQGAIPADAVPDSYMRPAEYLRLVAQLYFPRIPASEAARSFFEMGIIDSPEDWESTSQAGFLVTEGLRITMSALRIAEDAKREALAERYERELVDLPEDSQILLSSDTLSMLSGVFAREAGGNRARDVMDQLQTRFQANFGELLTTALLRSIRFEYYRSLGRGVPDAAVLPAYLDLGSCTRDLEYKLNWGTYVEAHQLGTMITCEGEKGALLLDLPAGSVILNGGMTPRNTSISSDEDYAAEAVRLDFAHSLANTLLIGEAGEERWRVSVFLNRTMPMTDKAFSFVVKDGDELLGPYGGQYDTDNSVEFLIPLRAFASASLKLYVEFDNH